MKGNALSRDITPIKRISVWRKRDGMWNIPDCFPLIVFDQQAITDDQRVHIGSDKAGPCIFRSMNDRLSADIKGSVDEERAAMFLLENLEQTMEER